MSVCEIVSVGTELLLGDIMDSNARFLSKELAKLGITVFRRSTVGDNPERLFQTLKTALERSDAVIATGGLGPTDDDITREIGVKVMGFEAEFDPGLAAEIEGYFASRGKKTPKNNYRQANAPRGGAVFPNENGTAPGLGMKKNGKCLILLPGPPCEAEPMFKKFVVPYLADYADGTIVSQTVVTAGIGESAAAELTAELLSGKNPTVATYAKTGEVIFRATARAENEKEALKLCGAAVERLKEKLGDYVVGVGPASAEERLVALLKENGLTVAAAESCTGGYIAKRITDVPGASGVFGFGATTYSNEAKTKLLGVKKETLEKFGAVSENTAREMAAGIRRASGADVGISSTGIAGPDSDGTDGPVGLCYVALDAPDYSACEKILTGKNDREYNRFLAASRALDLAGIYVERKNGNKTD